MQRWIKLAACSAGRRGRLGVSTMLDLLLPPTPAAATAAAARRGGGAFSHKTGVAPWHGRAGAVPDQPRGTLLPGRRRAPVVAPCLGPRAHAEDRSPCVHVSGCGTSQLALRNDPVAPITLSMWQHARELLPLCAQPACTSPCGPCWPRTPGARSRCSAQRGPWRPCC